MFKKFTVDDGVSNQNLVKSSVQRAIRSARQSLCPPFQCAKHRGNAECSARPSTGKIGEQYPSLEDGGALDVLLPKKEKMVVAKWRVGLRVSRACRETHRFTLRGMAKHAAPSD